MTRPFVDTAEPTASLQPLGPPQEFFDPAFALNGIGDLLSPTVWVSEVLDLAFGFNPLDEAAQWLAGDWAGYVDAANAWRSIADATAAVARNIESGLVTLDGTWDGNAAVTATNHFRDVIEALRNQRAVLDSAHEEYLEAGRAVWLMGKAVVDGLKLIGDAALIAALEVAAGTLLAETVVGPALLYPLAAAEIATMVRLWGAATAEISAAQIVVNASAGVITDLLIALDDVERIPVPASAFDNPAVP